MFLGEWVPSNLMFGAAFLVAGIGCFALGAWVLRGDRLNRRLIDEQEAGPAAAGELPEESRTQSATEGT